MIDKDDSAIVLGKDKILYTLTHEIKSSFSSYFKKPKDSFTSVPSRSKLEAP